MVIVYSTLIGIAAYALHLYNFGSRLTPDGRFYLERGRGEPVPTPYRYRWLLPYILRANVRTWNVVTGVALVLTCPLIALFGATAPITAVLLWVGLPWFRLGVRYPVLTDAPAMFLVLLGAFLGGHDYWILAILLVGIAAMMRESAPIFACALTLSPWFLISMIPVIFAYFLTEKGEIPGDCQWLRTPVKSAWEFHGTKLLNPRFMLLPWGAVLVALLSPHLVYALPVLALAYGQMLVANDFARLYQWAAPMMVVLAAPLIGPMWWAIPLLALHLMNPWAEIEV